MINMPTTDMLTLLTRDVEAPAKGGQSTAAGPSFHSIVAGDQPVIAGRATGHTLLPRVGMRVEPGQDAPDYFSSRLAFPADFDVPTADAAPVVDVDDSDGPTDIVTNIPERTPNFKDAAPVFAPSIETFPKVENAVARVTVDVPVIADDAVTTGAPVIADVPVIVGDVVTTDAPVDVETLQDRARPKSPITMHAGDAVSLSLPPVLATPLRTDQQATPPVQNATSPAPEQIVTRQAQPELHAQTERQAYFATPANFRPAAQIEQPVSRTIDQPVDGVKPQIALPDKPTFSQPRPVPAKAQSEATDPALGAPVRPSSEAATGAVQGSVDRPTPAMVPTQRQMPRTELPIDTGVDHRPPQKTTEMGRETGTGVVRETGQNLTARADHARPQTWAMPNLPPPSNVPSNAPTAPTRPEFDRRQTAAQPQPTDAATLPPAPSSATPQPTPLTPLQPAVLTPEPALRSAIKTETAKSKDAPIPAPDAPVIRQTNEVQSAATSQMPPLMPNPEIAQTAASDLVAFPEVAPLEMQGLDGLTVTRQDSNLNRPEVMRHVAQQLADVARQMPDRPVELTLNPDELGRVRLTFTTTDGGISVAVIAERGETMDLLRRHIETLAQEFRDLGYKDVNFDFSRSGAGRDQSGADGDPNTQDQTTTSDTAPADIDAPVQLSLDPSAGLDLRL